MILVVCIGRYCCLPWGLLVPLAAVMVMKWSCDDDGDLVLALYH